MRFREARGSRRARFGVAATLSVGMLGTAGCGEDDFENEPRPPAPIEITAAIDDRSVNVSPGSFGAGLVTITISNQTDEPTRLLLEGPTDAESTDIVPGGTGSIKTALEEGEYEASADSDLGIRSQSVKVGPERESSQNDLLLP
jgi:hypothetical protein